MALSPVLNPYKHTRALTDEWTKDTAGGCSNNPTFIRNPVYRLEIEGAGPLGAAEVLFKVEGPRKFSVGFQLTPEVKTPSLPQMTSGPYRPGLAVLETSLPPGNYSIVPSTFIPGEVAPLPLFLERWLRSFSRSLVLTASKLTELSRDIGFILFNNFQFVISYKA